MSMALRGDFADTTGKFGPFYGENGGCISFICPEQERKKL